MIAWQHSSYNMSFFVIFQVRVMERRLNDSDWQTPTTSNIAKTKMSVSIRSESQPCTDTHSGSYPEEEEDGVTVKDQLIRDLESEVEQQRQLRLADAKQVEAKAARIKVWKLTHTHAQTIMCFEIMSV